VNDARHDARSKYFHCSTIANFAGGSKKRFVVLLSAKTFCRESPLHYVIDSSGILNTKRPHHKTGTTIARLSKINPTPEQKKCIY
jgi:hypothetical protein